MTTRNSTEEKSLCDLFVTSINESVYKYTLGNVWRFPQHSVPHTPTRGPRGNCEYFPKETNVLIWKFGKISTFLQMLILPTTNIVIWPQVISVKTQ